MEREPEDPGLARRSVLCDRDLEIEAAAVGIDAGGRKPDDLHGGKALFHHFLSRLYSINVRLLAAVRGRS